MPKKEIPGQYNYDYITGNGVCPDDTANVIVDVDLDCDYLNLQEVYFQGMDVYPNPTTGNRVLISGLNETLEARIYDVMGREILNTSVSPSESSIDISNLKSNVYLLKLKNDKSSRVHTIVRH